MLHSFVSPPSLSHTNTKYTCTHTHSHTSPTFSHLGELLFSRFQSICQLVILQNNERKIEVLMSVNEQIIYCYTYSENVNVDLGRIDNGNINMQRVWEAGGGGNGEGC